MTNMDRINRLKNAAGENEKTRRTQATGPKTAGWAFENVDGVLDMGQNEPHNVTCELHLPEHGDREIPEQRTKCENL